MIFACAISILIVFMTLFVIIESLPQFHHCEGSIIVFTKVSIITVFAIEFAARSYSRSNNFENFLRYCTSLLTLLDAFAIFPALFEWLFVRECSKSDFYRFSVLRLFRILRFLKSILHSNNILQLSYDAFLLAIKRSRATLLIILTVQVILIVIFSTFLYIAERGTWDEEKKMYLVKESASPFSSIPETFWFVVEVITTVGLGEVHPQTIAGKIISFPLMLFGLLLIASPSIILGKNFSDAWHWIKGLPTEVRNRIDRMDLPDLLPSNHKSTQRQNDISSTKYNAEFIQKDSFIVLTPEQQVEIYAMLKALVNELPTRQEAKGISDKIGCQKESKDQ